MLWLFLLGWMFLTQCGPPTPYPRQRAGLLHSNKSLSRNSRKNTELDYCGFIWHVDCGRNATELPKGINANRKGRLVDIEIRMQQLCASGGHRNGVMFSFGKNRC